jgi:hypothetical protein
VAPGPHDEYSLFRWISTRLSLAAPTKQVPSAIGYRGWVENRPSSVSCSMTPSRRKLPFQLKAARRLRSLGTEDFAGITFKKAQAGKVNQPLPGEFT